MSAVGVCGFGRCGSTMLMAMLDAGGIPPVATADPGTYEHDPTVTLAAADYEGRAVKLLDGTIPRDLPRIGWRIVWLDRDPIEQARSFVKFARGILEIPLPPGSHLLVAATYGRDRPRSIARVAKLGPALTLAYEDVLADPRRAAAELGAHVADGRPFDVDAAAAVVHRRDPSCAPDLSVEAAASEAAAAAAGVRS